MQGIKRKLVYVSFYELIAIAITTTGLMLLSGQSMEHTGVAAVVSSAIALIWNLIYNTLFEAWESRQIQKGRTVWRRILHALGFELGLIVTLVPFFAWWLNVTLLHALVLDFGLIIFFLVYTFIFNLMFDHLFGLPSSALPSGKAA
jgi:uncharacterized membrane protein